MAIKTYGTMAVDWERRIDFDRLRRERLDRIKGLLAKSEMGSVLCFDMNNVRYITATHIGTWAQDKISRFTLLAQDAEPILWDFGSAARHHQLNCDWLGDRSRAGIPLMRGAMTPEMGRSEDVARKIKIELEERGLLNEPVGVDVVEPPVMFALQREGINVVDGQELMSIAREIKTEEQRAGITDTAHFAYPTYARAAMVRRDNLRGSANDLKDKLDEVPYIGVLFIVLIVSSLVLAELLLRVDDLWVWIAAGLLAGGTMLAYVLSRTVGLPGEEDE